MPSTPDQRTPAPFLKWAGGKRQLLDALLPHVPRRFERFVEPFVGGGAMFFALAARMPGLRASLGDANPDLPPTYEAVRDRLEPLCAHLAALAADHGPERYAERRARFNGLDGGEPADPVERAALLIYLNRTCFNGLYRVNSQGRFNVPMGRYKNPAIFDRPRLEAASRALAGATLRVADFDVLLGEAGPGDFVYLDPPYIPLSATANFTAYAKEGFGPDDQVRLADAAAAARDRGATVLLSNHDTEVLRTLYGDRGFRVDSVPVTRAINSKASERGTPVAEAIVFSG